MKTSESITEIATAVIGFQSTMKTLPKDASGYGYKYTPLDTVVETITPLLAAVGLGYVQMPSNESESGLSLTTRLIHISGQWMESTLNIPIPVVGKSNEAQAYGAALTYARRYALTAMLGIVADEDVDANMPSEKPAKKAKAKAKAKAASPSLPPAKLKELNTVGSGKYKGDWNNKRPELVKSVTKGRATSSKELTVAEADKLIKGMSK